MLVQDASSRFCSSSSSPLSCERLPVPFLFTSMLTRLAFPQYSTSRTPQGHPVFAMPLVYETTVPTTQPHMPDQRTTPGMHTSLPTRNIFSHFPDSVPQYSLRVRRYPGTHAD